MEPITVMAIMNTGIVPKTLSRPEPITEEDRQHDDGVHTVTERILGVGAQVVAAGLCREELHRTGDFTTTIESNSKRL